MGYSLRFGTFHADVYPEDRYCTASCKVPDDVDLPEGPYDSGTPCFKSTGPDLHPSYTAWKHFSDQLGITTMMYEEMIESHPGASAYTEEMQATLEAAQASYIERVGLTPEEAESLIRASLELAEEQKADMWRWEYPGVPEESWHLLRIRWLIFWGRWCLDTCEHPTFSNT